MGPGDGRVGADEANADEGNAGTVERAHATRTYRGFVRGTGIVVSFAVAGIFVLDAMLPTTSASDRIGLLIGAALVLVTGTVWFAFVPRSWFGGMRIFAATTVATIVILITLELTGGPRSQYLGYLVLPAIVLILAGSVNQMLALGAIMFGGIALMAAQAVLAGDTLGEAAPSRIVLLATVIGASAGVARATGRSRERVTERAAGLAEETAAARSLAKTDPLTGLGNRRALDEHLARFAADAQRTGVPFSVVALDIDGLKRVNDEAGHDAGDALLRDFARAIDQAIRGSDIGLRSGGDEFVLLLPRTNEVAARTVAERLVVASERFSTPFGPPRFSYGIATYGRGEPEYDVMTRADAALNQQKRERGGRS